MPYPSLTFILLFICHLAFGQSGINDKIDFKAENTPLPEALIQLSEQSRTNIAFSNSILPKDVLVTINAKQEPFKLVLREVLANTNLSFRMVSGQVVLFRQNTQKLESLSINGYIEDADTGEKLVGANIYNPNNAYGTESNEYGYFNFYGVPNVDSIFISYLGYETQKFLITREKSNNLIIKLKPSFFETILVTDDDNGEDFLQRSTLGVERLDLSNLQNVVSIGGEADLFQAAYQLGGINSGADGVGGLHVRGGNLDQNLILLDGAPIYRPEHAIGILSVFNSDAVRSANVYKGNFPSKYGGRLSSVIDVQTIEGNNQEFEGKLSLGLLTAKASLQGPIIKDKASFFLSYRRSFTDLYVPELTRLVAEREGIDRFSDYFFQDLNAKANVKLTNSDRIYFSYYEGRDDFVNNTQDPVRTFVFTRDNEEEEITGTIMDGDTDELNWGNRVMSLRWNHIFGDRIFANTTAYISNFDFFSREEFRSVGDYDDGSNDLILVNRVFDSRVNDRGIRTDVEFLQSDRLNFKFGVGIVEHKLSPGSFESGIDLRDIPTAVVDSTLNVSVRDSLNLIEINASEAFAYYETGISLSRQLNLTLGLHARHWVYDDFNHTSILPRISLDYQMNDVVSFSASYLEMVQYLHLLTQSDIGLPGDIWVPATEAVGPEQATHFQIGANLQFKNDITIGLAGYYKEFNNLVEFLEGDSTNILNAINYESKVTSGIGTSRGLEFQFSKKSDKWKVFANYTLSETNRQFDELNNGEVFPYRFDLTHVFNGGGTYHFNNRWSANINWVFNTGINLTVPVGKFSVPTPFVGIDPVDIPIFSDRNAFKLASNHRLDIGFNYIKNGPKFKQALSLGIYNVYNRINPIFVKLRRNPMNPSEPQLVSVSLLPITPSVSYSISF